jgi:hypothetical protein
MELLISQREWTKVKNITEQLSVALDLTGIKQRPIRIALEIIALVVLGWYN